MKYILLAITLSTLQIQAVAQDGKADRRAEKRQRINAMIKQEEEGNLSYFKQNGFGLQVRTNGYGAFYEIGRRKSQRFTNTYSIELTEIKHNKEEKIGGAENFFGNPYVFGKINNFYQAKLGYGQQYIFGQKGNKNGVAVIAIGQAGLAMGLLKPYYINVDNRAIKYETDSTLFLTPNNLNTATGFTKGWSELKVKPGLFAKTALRFDFGRYNETVQAVEIGMSAEYFFQDIQIMALNKTNNLFFQGHLAFVMGRRKK